MGKNNLKKIIFIPLLFFIIFLIYPIALILIYSIQNIDLSSLIELIFNSRNALINSFTQAIASTIFSLILGLSAGYLISKYEFKGRKLLELSSFIPFVLPSVFVVLAMILFYGNNGLLNQLISFTGIKFNFLYGFSGIVLAHSFYNFPIIMRFASNALNELNENELNAGKMLGANKLQRFLKIELPSIMPSIISSSLLVFIYCFTSFAIVLSLGGAKYANFEVRIYQTIMHSLNLPQGIILALIQFILLSGLVFFYLNYSKKISSKKEKTIKRKKIKLNSIKGIILSITSIFFLIFVFAPIILVIISSITSITNQGIELILNNFFQGNIFQAIINSLFFGLSSAILSVLFSLMLVFGLKEKAEKTSIAFLSITAISSISLATGYWLSFGTGNPLLIIIAHAIISFPFVFRIILISFNKINKELIQASKTLGANEFQSITLIQLPLMKKALLAGFGFAFAISLGELGLTLMLFDGKWITLSVLMYRLISAHKMSLAALIGTIILLIDFLLIYLIQKKGDKNCLK